MHILYLPAHTTHVLQPLDVGGFKSFKSHFSKACSKYMSQHPGRVVTADKLVSLVAEAWPHSFTSVNIMSGFQKTGVYPLNPGEVSDRQLVPSKALCSLPQSCNTTSDSPPGSPLFSSEQVALYEKRCEEKYDLLDDPGYVTWLKSIIQIKKLAQVLPVPSHLARNHLKMFSLKSLCSLSRSQPQQGNLAEKQLPV